VRELDRYGLAGRWLAPLSLTVPGLYVFSLFLGPWGGRILLPSYWLSWWLGILDESLITVLYLEHFQTLKTMHIYFDARGTCQSRRVDVVWKIES